MKTLLSLGVLSCVALSVNSAAGLVSIAEVNPDAGKVSLIESGFGEDAWCFVDRTHEYNGAMFTSAGVLTTTAAADNIIIGLPSYLLGLQYVANANTHRDNAGYQLSLTLDTPSRVYLLVDNRLGDNDNTTPPTLGSGGSGLMPWVADMGFTRMNTGIAPNGAADVVGIDEGGTVATPAERAHAGASQPNLGTGPGQALNQFSTVYALDVPAGTLTLGEQNGGGLNMYGVAVAAVPEPSPLALFALGFGALFLARRRS